MYYSLKDLPERGKARVVSLHGEGDTVRHLMGLGFGKAVFIRLIRRLFFGNNYIVEVGNEHFVLRENEAQCLRVTLLS